ncbi:MAG: hypothetical protein WCL39_15720, partial [Armatimonadota bacterium]
DTDGQTSVGFDAAFSHAFLAPSAPYAAATGSSVSVTVDGTPPEDFAPASQSASPNVYSVSFSTTDAGSGISHYEVKLDEGPYSTQTSPYTVDLSGLPDGQRAVKVKAVDLAGNKRIADLNLVVDHTAPTLLIKGISQNGNDLTLDGASAAAGVVNIQIRASDSASGLTGRPSVTVTPEDRSAEEATFVSVSGDVYNYTYAISTGTTQGIASVDVVVVDKSGNQASVQNRFNVAISQTISAELITQDGDCTNPAIGGNRVVFEKRSIVGGTSNIFLYDLITKTTRALAPGMNNQQNPRIWQDWVVWQEDGSRGSDIRLCNVKTNAVTTITNTGDCTVPRIADGLISWCRPVDVGTFQVFVVPLATPSAAFAMFGPSVANSTHHALSLDTLFVVTQNYDLTHLSRVMPVSLIEKRNLSPVGRQKSQSDPSTDGASVVWVEAGASSTDTSVWSRNLRNGGERQVTNSAAERKLPEVAGDIVAWLEKRNGAWEIWASRLSNSTVFPLAVGQAERDNLDADGGHIAWQRVFEDRHVIMLATVDGSPVAIRGMGEGRLFQDNSL